MPFTNGDVYHPLIERIRSNRPLSSDAERALRMLPLNITSHAPREDIVADYSAPTSSMFIIEGTAASYKLDQQGVRQITSFHLPGDMPDLMSLHLPQIDTAISAVGACRVAHVKHTDLIALCDASSEVTQALWRLNLIDAAIIREWVRNVGRRSAIARLAHLLCETLTRTEAVGLGSRDQCPFPINQQHLADATGLTPVHLNRTLQQLRSRSLIALDRRTLSVPSFARLAAAGEFNADYLYIREQL